jgi:hypothetical protein
MSNRKLPVGWYGPWSQAEPAGKCVTAQGLKAMVSSLQEEPLGDAGYGPTSCLRCSRTLDDHELSRGKAGAYLAGE